MKKTCLLSLSGLLLALLISVQAAQPNILLIVSEDNGPELGCYGDPYARTPVLDKLAGEGVLFHNAYVTQAGCSQSRASFLTGLYPHQHGQIGLATWGFRLYREDTPNLPLSLKEAGYRTGLIGKLHINPESAFPYDMKEIPSGNFARKNLGDYARFAEAFMKAGTEPFFLHVNYPDAHDPWLRQVDGLPRDPQSGGDVKAMPYFGIDPPEMREMIADYYNSISRLDTLVGDLLKALRNSGKADNTLVVYLGDHGADMLRGKRTCYEGGVRIPLIVRWPGVAKPQVRNELVSTIDLVPTLLSAAKARTLPDLPGASLYPLIVGEAVSWRKHLFTEFHTHAAKANFYPQRAVRNGRYKLIENLLLDEENPGYADTFRKLEADAVERGQAGFDGGLPRSVANAAPEVRAAYALMKKPPRYELYDLQADPYEFRNLVDDSRHATAFNELKQSLLSWRQQTNDPLLDPVNLQLLKAEVYGLPSKAEGKKRGWNYPDYFFGKEPSSVKGHPPQPSASSKNRKPTNQSR